MLQYIAEFLHLVFLAVVTTSVQPEGEIQENEKPVGVMSKYLQRIYTVYSKSCDELYEICRQYHECPDDIKLQIKHAKAHYRHDIITAILRQAIREEFPDQLMLASEDVKMAVRKGWWVVMYLDPEDADREESHILRHALIIGNSNMHKSLPDPILTW
ncbi:MAG: hypothetical protein NT094_02670 [Candidatus Staskawiczbacteria bacterium]|nr:hypothetical protein [Candidatus Staskawiczbacteria bacterium]